MPRSSRKQPPGERYCNECRKYFKVAKGGVVKHSNNVHGGRDTFDAVVVRHQDTNVMAQFDLDEASSDGTSDVAMHDSDDPGLFCVGIGDDDDPPLPHDVEEEEDDDSFFVFDFIDTDQKFRNKEAQWLAAETAQ